MAKNKPGTKPARHNRTTDLLKCSFCGTGQSQTPKLIAGPDRTGTRGTAQHGILDSMTIATTAHHPRGREAHEDL